ncbi:MAG: response regulator [Gemmataceae bacterium]|nr:response regulator [Gemmataceae bacterium]
MAAKQEYSILIADDDSPCRETLREIVEGEGFRALVASSGEEALDLIRFTKVHLAMLDMHMPCLSGLETLHLLRQIHALIPAILVTGDPTEAILRQAQQAAVFSVIPKPINRRMVAYTLVRAMSRYYETPMGGN